jgi:hypothetical protein
MSLGVEDIFVEADYIGRGEDEIKIFQRLGQPEALSRKKKSENGF